MTTIKRYSTETKKGKYIRKWKEISRTL